MMDTMIHIKNPEKSYEYKYIISIIIVNICKIIVNKLLYCPVTQNFIQVALQPSSGMATASLKKTADQSTMRSCDQWFCRVAALRSSPTSKKPCLFGTDLFQKGESLN